ncbi:hypothetical protein HanXRQr2_Chr10g0424131 [Helianthus annuus]|uniref:Uncharacterized protein n=1 Tax=Helianthus annuus TaxID=4232 RepID=A0A251TFV8_HELAN|nr:hypothetical protein HanXRQr2_Chr10g0424131 [Helianthus annuus]KAJ0520257.1 hypothetical protein HanIR_Chr10g0457371 [Helianthus annuus]
MQKLYYTQPLLLSANYTTRRNLSLSLLKVAGTRRSHRRSENKPETRKLCSVYIPPNHHLVRTSCTLARTIWTTLEFYRCEPSSPGLA